MNTLLSVILVVFLVVIAGFLIPLLLELKKTVVALRITTERKLNPALEELHLMLKNVRGISNTVNDITDNVRGLTDSLTEVSSRIHAVNQLVGGIGSSASVRALSLKAGVTAALTYLITNLLRKGDRQ